MSNDSKVRVVLSGSGFRWECLVCGVFGPLFSFEYDGDDEYYEAKESAMNFGTAHAAAFHTQTMPEPDEQQTALSEAAVAAHELFTAYAAAGFTEDQALKLVTLIGLGQPK